MFYRAPKWWAGWKKRWPPALRYGHCLVSIRQMSGVTSEPHLAHPENVRPNNFLFNACVRRWCQKYSSVLLRPCYFCWEGGGYMELGTSWNRRGMWKSPGPSAGLKCSVCCFFGGEIRPNSIHSDNWGLIITPQKTNIYPPENVMVGRWPFPIEKGPLFGSTNSLIFGGVWIELAHNFSAKFCKIAVGVEWEVLWTKNEVKMQWSQSMWSDTWKDFMVRHRYRWYLSRFEEISEIEKSH